MALPPPSNCSTIWTANQFQVHRAGRAAALAAAPRVGPLAVKVSPGAAWRRRSCSCRLLQRCSTRIVFRREAAQEYSLAFQRQVSVSKRTVSSSAAKRRRRDTLAPLSYVPSELAINVCAHLEPAVETAGCTPLPLRGGAPAAGIGSGSPCRSPGGHGFSGSGVAS